MVEMHTDLLKGELAESKPKGQETLCSQQRQTREEQRNMSVNLRRNKHVGSSNMKKTKKCIFNQWTRKIESIKKRWLRKLQKGVELSPSRVTIVQICSITII